MPKEGGYGTAAKAERQTFTPATGRPSTGGPTAQATARRPARPTAARTTPSEAARPRTGVGSTPTKAGSTTGLRRTAPIATPARGLALHAAVLPRYGWAAPTPAALRPRKLRQTFLEGGGVSPAASRQAQRRSTTLSASKRACPERQSRPPVCLRTRSARTPTARYCPAQASTQRRHTRLSACPADFFRRRLRNGQTDSPY